MRKTTLSLVASMLFVSGAIAQPAFTTADMPNIGDEDTVINATYTHTGDFDVETGNGYTWDFSGIVLNPNLFDLEVFRVKTHAVSMQAPFDPATIENYKTGVSAQNVALFSYSNDTLLMYRRGGTTQGQNFIPPVGVIKFPVSFNQTSDITSPTYIGTLLAGEKRVRVTYDGFGTLILPGNMTYTDVFRVKQVEEDTSYVLNNFTTSITYIWYKQGGAVPLLKMIYSGVPTVYSAIVSKANGIGTSVKELADLRAISIFPNPVGNELNLMLDQKEKVKEVVIYDISGKTVGIYKNGASVVNTSDLAGGTYFLRVLTSGNSYSGTFVKQ